MSVSTTVNSSVGMDRTIHLMNQFRKFCRHDLGLTEERRKPLVSKHDPTIMFTNSTTSVLKPYLQSGVPAPGVFLIQPAMGQQGMEQWRREQVLGGYSSYWYSMGTLQPANAFNAAAVAGHDFLTRNLQVDPDKIVVRISSVDADIQRAFSNTNIRTEFDGYDLPNYRHRYGMDGVFGRNANYAIDTGDGVLRDVGNLTLIESNGVAVATELSFDSTTVVSVTHGLKHPIMALPAASVFPLRETKPEDAHDMVTADAATLSTALMMEGLQPASKGRSGKLRTFCKIMSEGVLSRTFNADEFYDTIRVAAKQELAMRAEASPGDEVYETVSPDEVAGHLLNAVKQSSESSHHELAFN